jgi:hypothetical protein
MGCRSIVEGGGATEADVAEATAEVLREQSIIDLLTCLLKEQRRTNAYLSALTELTIEDPDIPV